MEQRHSVKLKVAHLVKEFLASYGSRKFISVFTRSAEY